MDGRQFMRLDVERSWRDWWTDLWKLNHSTETWTRDCDSGWVLSHECRSCLFLGHLVSGTFWVNASRAILLLTFTNVNNNSNLIIVFIVKNDLEKDVRGKWFTCNSTIDLLQSQCKTQRRAKP